MLGCTLRSCIAGIHQLTIALCRGSARVDDQNPEAKFQALKKYGIDLVERAQQGKLDPVIGRDQEIRLLPPTPRFFNSACLPFKIPVNEWRQAIDDGEDEAFHKRNCPESMKYLWDSAMRANPSDPQAWMDRVQEVVGYMPSWYRAMHAVFLLYGGSGSGKDVMLSQIGRAHV